MATAARVGDDQLTHSHTGEQTWHIEPGTFVKVPAYNQLIVRSSAVPRPLWR